MDVSFSWTSRSLIEPYSPEMLAVVRGALAFNRAMGITGALYFTSSSFFQVLEGRPEAVEAAFRRIERDWRHMQVTPVDERPIGRRMFPGHDMKFVDGTRHHVLDREVDFDRIVAMRPGQRRELALALAKA